MSTERVRRTLQTFLIDEPVPTWPEDARKPEARDSHLKRCAAGDAPHPDSVRRAQSDLSPQAAELSHMAAQHVTLPLPACGERSTARNARAGEGASPHRRRRVNGNAPSPGLLRSPT